MASVTSCDENERHIPPTVDNSVRHLSASLAPYGMRAGSRRQQHDGDAETPRASSRHMVDNAMGRSPNSDVNVRLEVMPVNTLSVDDLLAPAVVGHHRGGKAKLSEL